MIISFNLTVSELLAGKKTVTRRAWKETYFEDWKRAYLKNKKYHQAYNKAAYAGGYQIGDIQLTCCPYRERLENMPKEDLLHEGGMCETLDQFYKLIQLNPADVVTVLRFNFTPLLV